MYNTRYIHERPLIDVYLFFLAIFNIHREGTTTDARVTGRSDVIRDEIRAMRRD